ncbi:hypothetical protein RCO48_37350 [Peribacillus frigoritolerans]|nr:hypothetical protein [Peribacillus frigoritolerans]
MKVCESRGSMTPSMAPIIAPPSELLRDSITAVKPNGLPMRKPATAHIAMARTVKTASLPGIRNDSIKLKVKLVVMLNIMTMHLPRPTPI